MSEPARNLMTVDAFLAWWEDQATDARYELIGGEIVAMSPERTGHMERKFAVAVALTEAIKRVGQDCWALPDGATVIVDEHTAFEPDALVYCGPKVPSDTVVIPNPIVVVEVLSPSTRHIDLSLKLTGYFKVPSIRHYLIINADETSVIHHRRAGDETVMTRFITDGVITLDPPGLEITIESIYP